MTEPVDPKGWRRDYVVAAFNDDKPLDEFIRQQIAGDARAGGADVQAPQRRPALRKLRRDRPVLEEFGAEVEDFSQPALIDLLGTEVLPALRS